MKGALDYDDSLVPGQIVASVMHLPHVTDREERDLGLLLRWSYGSAFGLWHGVLRRIVREPWASVGFGATLMTATLTLFPLLGRTPPPWRWPADVMATSIGTHVAYVSAVAAVDDGLRRAVGRTRSARTSGVGLTFIQTSSCLRPLAASPSTASATRSLARGGCRIAR